MVLEGENGQILLGLKKDTLRTGRLREDETAEGDILRVHGHDVGVRRAGVVPVEVEYVGVGRRVGVLLKTAAGVLPEPVDEEGVLVSRRREATKEDVDVRGLKDGVSTRPVLPQTENVVEVRTRLGGVNVRGVVSTVVPRLLVLRQFLLGSFHHFPFVTGEEKDIKAMRDREERKRESRGPGVVFRVSIKGRKNMHRKREV